jgi:glutaminyl-tRNA synthetase
MNASSKDALPPEEFIASVWQERRRYVREGRIKQPHPWRVALSQGKVSKAALQEYVKNRYYFLANINPSSLEVLTGCKLEPALGEAAPGFRCQFERLGYFCPDRDATAERLVFNRTLGLKDSWAKLQQ